QVLETGQLFHKNHLLYRPLGYVLYAIAGGAGYSGKSLAVLQVLNAILGATGAGLCYVTFKHILRDEAAALIGTIWLATSLSYWYFSTDAGYIMLAAFFA